MAAISLRKVFKRYGTGPKANPVIHGVDAEIGDGEFVVIVGPSGCGKSTLLRMVAGLEEISEGEIAIGGRVVNQVEPSARNIAMVFQNYALYPHMSVFDNMAYGLKIARLPPSEIRVRVDKAAKILELGALLQRRGLADSILGGEYEPGAERFVAAATGPAGCGAGPFPLTAGHGGLGDGVVGSAGRVEPALEPAIGFALVVERSG